MSELFNKEAIAARLVAIRPVIDAAIEKVKQDAKNNQISYCIRIHAYAADVMFCIDEDGWTTLSVLIANANDHNFCQAVWREVNEHELLAEFDSVEIRSEW